MYTIVQTSRFRKDVKRAKKRDYDLAKLKTVIRTLSQGEQLDPSYKDHPLKGEWEGCRDCHLEFDWVLVYAIDEEAGELVLIRKVPTPISLSDTGGQRPRTIYPVHGGVP